MSISNVNYSSMSSMSSVAENEEKIVYCKYCGKNWIKLVSTTKENPGRIFFVCSTPRFVGVHGWMDWADRAYGTSYSRSHKGRFDAIEHVVLLESLKMDQAMQYVQLEFLA
ncbi:hypothetical protein LIER_40560 [Lithospermum erythrorhizon]|uniref:GRF-type domain-containing protein n=1 Tax=Lithospermum erythrorhizon TaxID=34254 RepID=A0AAV3QWB0_LITER